MICNRIRFCFIAVLVFVVDASATTINLKNGMRIEGRFGDRASLAESPLRPAPGNSATALKLIAFTDDGLRRSYISKYNIVDAPVEEPPATQERIKIKQAVPESGRRIESLGAILGATPFDDFGRRVLSTVTERGQLDIIQGITEITPTYTTIEGLLVKNPIICASRVATSSIPRDRLSAILANYIDRKNLDERLRVVRLYTQAERYEDAREELKVLIADFPDQVQLQKHVTALQQLSANRFLREIETRREAGQHLLAIEMLNAFPDKDVAGETLIKVRDMLNEYERIRGQMIRVQELVTEHLGKVEDPVMLEKIGPICDEIKNEINIHNWDRFSDYLRLADDPKTGSEEKLALAIGGWLLGNGGGIENLAVTASLVQVREEVRKYLRSERKSERDEILERMRSLEGNTPTFVSKIIANMKPPVETEYEFVNSTIGLLHEAVPSGIDETEYHYLIQLPPNYDPYRRYPCIVTLNGAGTSELQQIDWWSGTYDANRQMRLGQEVAAGNFSHPTE